MNEIIQLMSQHVGKSEWYGVLLLFWATFVVMQWYGKLPKIQSIHDLVDLMNSRGGNLLILTIMVGGFFHAAMVLYFHVMSLYERKLITPDNALVSIGWSFVTGTAFGGAFGALLNAMSGSASKSRATDKQNGEEPTATTAKVELPKPGPVESPAVNHAVLQEIPTDPQRL
jgi:Na+/phosphate symporter